jgi:hypothetical protein
MRSVIMLYGVLIVACAAGVRAGELRNEPMDFRGIAWGAPFESYANEMTLVRKDDDVTFYKRKGDKLSIGQAEAIKVAYRFYKNKFSGGVIQTYGASNARALRDTLQNTFGEPERLSKRLQIYGWEGGAARIRLMCEVTSYCAAEFVSKEIVALEEAETGQKVEVLKKDDDGNGDDD